MFPITDPSRADDIRMRRRRAAWLLAGIVAFPVIAFSGGPSSTGRRHHPAIYMDFDLDDADVPIGERRNAALSATGTALMVALPGCADSVTLVPQADLSDRVYVSARGRHRSDHSGMQLTGTREIVLSGECRHGSSDFVIQAPDSMPLRLVQSGSTEFHVGAFKGPIHLTQTGDGDVAIDAAGGLDIENTGEGDITVSRLDGALRYTGSRSGDFSIGNIQADQVHVASAGSGDISISEGRIGQLEAVMRGSGDLSVGADVENATIQAREDSDVDLPHIKGRLDRTVLN